METWQIVVATIGGNAVLLGAVAWIIRAIIGQVLAKDLEKFKSELSSASDLAIEKARFEFQLETDATRHRLQLTAQEQNIMLAELHKKRATVLAELYSLLAEFRWLAESFVSPAEWAGAPSKREKYGKTIDKSAELYRYFEKNQIYLPEHLCILIQEFMQSLRSRVVGFGIHTTRDEDEMTDTALRKMHEAWSEGWSYFATEEPKARQALNYEFRKLLGSDPSASVIA